MSALHDTTLLHTYEQVKQLLYAPARRQRLGVEDDVSAAALEQEQESALLGELAEGDFSPDQNVVEVCFLQAKASVCWNGYCGDISLVPSRGHAGRESYVTS